MEDLVLGRTVWETVSIKNDVMLSNCMFSKSPIRAPGMSFFPDFEMPPRPDVGTSGHSGQKGHLGLIVTAEFEDIV